MQIINHDNGLTVHKIESGLPGPHLLIFGAIHGDEQAGTIATQKLLERLNNKEINIERGTLTICSICNPKAYEKDVRYIDINLNRLFGNPSPSDGYEVTLSETLMNLIDDCDYLLDIHSTHVPGDPAFVFVEHESGEAYEFAQCLNVDNIFFDWNKVYQGEDYSTEAYGNQNNKIAVTIECGYHKDKNAQIIANQAITNALDYLGIIPSPATIIQKSADKYRFGSFERRAEGDIFLAQWKHMDGIKKDDPIFKRKDGSFFNAKEDGYIFIPNKDALIGDEFFFFGVKATD